MVSDKEDIDYQQQISPLLQHADFLLLHVPDDGSKMKLIKPATDPYHGKRIKDWYHEMSVLPHYALSHVWGVSHAEEHLWHDIGHYVDDEHGQPVAPVSMRPEKRETLLKLLYGMPGSYWWIDVLCARTDTPLDIMGDIYKHCMKCIAMIDCETESLQQIRLLIKEQQDTFQYQYEQYTADEFRKRTDALDAMTHCQWWKRVWTWQECVLPKQVSLMAETDTQHALLPIEDLFRFFHILKMCAPALSTALEEWNSRPSTVSFLEIKKARAVAKMQGTLQMPIYASVVLIRTFGISFRQCMDPVDYVYGVLGVLKLDIPRMTDPQAVWECFLIKLDELLSRTSYAMPKNAPTANIQIHPDAYQFNLATARNMADVYHCLLDIKEIK